MTNRTCDSQWHVYRKGHKLCDCGERKSLIYRTPWQRLKDRINFIKIQLRR